MKSALERGAHVGVLLLAYTFSSSSLAGGKGELSVALTGGLIGKLRYYATPKDRPGPGIWSIEPPYWEPEWLGDYKFRFPDGAVHDFRAAMVAKLEHAVLAQQWQLFKLRDPRAASREKTLAVLDAVARKAGYKSLEDELLSQVRDPFLKQWRGNWNDLYHASPRLMAKHIDQGAPTLILAGPFGMISDFPRVWGRMQSIQQELATGGASQADVALALCSDVAFASRFNQASGIETVGIAKPGSQIVVTHGSSRLTAWFETQLGKDARNSIIFVFGNGGVGPDDALVLHKQVTVEMHGGKGKLITSPLIESLPLNAAQGLLRAKILYGGGSQLSGSQPTF